MSCGSRIGHFHRAHQVERGLHVGLIEALPVGGARHPGDVKDDIHIAHGLPEHLSVREIAAHRGDVERLEPLLATAHEAPYLVVPPAKQLLHKVTAHEAGAARDKGCPPLLLAGYFFRHDAALRSKFSSATGNACRLEKIRTGRFLFTFSD